MRTEWADLWPTYGVHNTAEVESYMRAGMMNTEASVDRVLQLSVLTTRILNVAKRVR